MKWTPSQEEAITARGGDLLVTAAAGSGKTAVLTERIVSLVTDPLHPVSLDRILVVTFSRAAALEMRTRIAKRLFSLLRERPEDAHLRRQTLLLPDAPISTIHSFCYRLIRENAPKLGLPGSLRIGEPQEMELLQRDVLETVLEEEYERKDGRFASLVELLCGTRSDEMLGEILIRIRRFARNHPHYDAWIAEFLSAGRTQPFEDSVYARILKEVAREALENGVRRLSEVRGAVAADRELAPRLTPFLEREAGKLRELLRTAEREPWNAVRRSLGEITFERFPSIRGPAAGALKNRTLAVRNAVKRDVRELLGGLFLMSSEAADADREALCPLVEKLFDLVLRFDGAFQAAKAEKGRLDYGDLEHGTLSLLEENGKPSELARSLGGQYAEILMDEYQDTNELQERIFSLLSECGCHRFLVGDVKQSIYAFREACPEIFVEKKDRFRPYGRGGFPAKIALSENFRSRKEITNCVNTIFGELMSPVIGDMRYLEEDRLVSAYPYDGRDVPVTFLALDAPPGALREECLSIEARETADEIEELLGNAPTVETRTGRRPLEPRDICILLRSARDRAEIYHDALRRKRIPVRLERKNGFLESAEIAPVLAYLGILKNPVQDLEVAKVLLSAMYGGTADDIGRLRARGGDAGLFKTVGEAPFRTEPMFSAFLNDYADLRRLLLSAPVPDLLRELYRRTDYLEKCSASPSGERMILNLQLLLEMASDYESGGRREDFTAYLSHLRENGLDFPPAPVPEENAVSILTVHKSKGLEFPVVFLVNLTQRFNMEDVKTPFVMHRKLGFACKYRDNVRMCQHDTLPLVAIRTEKRRESLSEELRILYVALTRAREKLYLVAAKPDLGQELRRDSGRISALSPWEIRSAHSHWDWLLPFAQRALGDGFPGTEVIVRGSEKRGDALPAEPEEETKRPPPADPGALRLLERQLAYRYPYPEDTKTPRRVTVSDLASREVREEHLLVRRPKVLLEEGLSPAERGTAAHRVMQFADIEALFQDTGAEIARLIREGFLFEEEGKLLDVSMIRDFIRSELGSRLRKAEDVRREFQVFSEFSADELHAVDPSIPISGSTMIMGAVDCLFLEDGEIVILDYKTDRVKTMDELSRRYRLQLALYRANLEKQLGIRVKEMLLYSFHLGRFISVEAETRP